MNLLKPMTMTVSALLLAAMPLLAATPEEVAPADEEVTTIPSNVPLRLATLEWPPYIGSELPDQGYVAVLVRAVFADEIMPVQIVFQPWERSLRLVRSGELDGLVPEYYNATRTEDMIYSDPFPGGPLVLYKRRADAIAFSVDPTVDQDAALQALKEKRFGVVRGYLNTPAFDAADYLTKEEVDNDATNLRSLVDGDIDLAVIDRRVAEYLIRNNYPDFDALIEPMDPPLANIPLYIGFSKKSRRRDEALAAFNHGLKKLRDDGRLEAMYQRYIIDAPATH